MKKCSLIFSVLWASVLTSSAQPPVEFKFELQETKILPGNSSDKGRYYGCGKGILPEDIIGNLAVASEIYQNGCYTDGQYNHRDFKVEKGVVTTSDGKLTLEAYRIWEPSHKAKEFLGSHHKVNFKFSSQVDQSVYNLKGNAITRITDIPADKVKPNGFTKIKDISASEIEGNEIFIFAPKSQRVSVFEEVASGVETATIFNKANFSISKTRFKVDGDLYNTPTGFPNGPSTHANIYGEARQFFSFSNGNQIEIVWQDQSNQSIHLTTLDPKNKTSDDLILPASDGRLAGVARDVDGDRIFYLTITKGRSPKIILNAASGPGKKIAAKELDRSKKGLNIWVYEGSEVTSLVFNQGVLGMIISRTMNKSSDGLNHQGAIALTLDPKTLTVIKNFNQTSGHSFDNVLYPSPEGGFYGFDLGDNYPRGVNLHRINGDRITSKVVYTFKTHHGMKAMSPARRTYPKYKEISSGKDKFYQWSNDNSTYSELGGIVPLDDAYGIFFIGEPDISGKAINNSRALGYLTDARDIGYVRIKKNFSYKVGEDVVSTGLNESAGFYTFGGDWSSQENKGLTWLTDYKDSNQQNASRLKACGFGSGNALLVWETWTRESYVSTHMMEVDSQGKPVSQPLDIGSQLRLNRRDEPLNHGGSVYLISGAGPDKMLELIEIRKK